MNLKEILMGGGGILVILTLVQVSQIKINPWSAISKLFSRAVNGKVLQKLDDMEKKLDRHITTDDRRTADGHRSRILHFNNELLRNIEHTKEEFVEVLAEIDAYERYCEDSPDYPNNRAVLAIENIRDNYKERLKRHDFLQEGARAKYED